MLYFCVVGRKVFCCVVFGWWCDGMFVLIVWVGFGLFDVGLGYVDVFGW